MRKLTRVVSNDGEILKERYKNIYSPFKEGVGYNLKYKSDKVKMYLNIHLPSDFTDSEVGKLYRLSENICSNSNLLAYRSHNKVRPYTKEDIQKMIDLNSRSKFYAFMSKVMEHKILKLITIDDEKFYCFNPLYFNSTNYIPLYLFIAFQDELAEHLPSWVVSKYLDMALHNGRS